MFTSKGYFAKYPRSVVRTVSCPKCGARIEEKCLILDPKPGEKYKVGNHSERIDRYGISIGNPREPFRE